MKIYHSNRDTLELISLNLLKNALELTLSFVLKLDFSSVLPYDFTSTANKILGDLTERTAKIEDTIGHRKLIEETLHFKVTSENFYNRLNSDREHLDDETIKCINETQRARALAPAFSSQRNP
jgi:hypothetical protein